MRTFGCLFLLSALSAALAQTQPAIRQPDIGMILCWNDKSEMRMAHDKVVLEAIGRAIGLGGKFTTLGVKSESCAVHMPDAACFGVPGGVMCQAAVIERQLRAASWIIARYKGAGRPPYESFRRANGEAVGYAVQYADGARPDEGADNVRAGLAEGADPLVNALADFNLAALLGHELSHTDDKLPCPIATKSMVEDTGLWQKIIRDELSGEIFGKHNADPNEVAADRCGLRHVRLLNDRIQSRLSGASPETVDFVRRFGADMMAFQLSFGWRRFKQLPNGKYAIFSQDQYLYSPYRATLFAVETRGAAAKPAICGYAAEVIVQGIQTTYTKTPGTANVDDDFLSYFPKGVETSWNGAPWTPDSFSCGAPSRRR